MWGDACIPTCIPHDLKSNSDVQQYLGEQQNWMFRSNYLGEALKSNAPQHLGDALKSNVPQHLGEALKRDVPQYLGETEVLMA